MPTTLSTNIAHVHYLLREQFYLFPQYTILNPAN